MLTTHQAAQITSNLPGAQVPDHFGSILRASDFRAGMARPERGEPHLKPEEQRRFLSIDGEGFSQIDSARGERGWTRVDLEFVEPARFEEALRCAWAHSAKKPRRRREEPRRPARKKESNTGKKAGKTATRKKR